MYLISRIFTVHKLSCKCSANKRN